MVWYVSVWVCGVCVCVCVCGVCVCVWCVCVCVFKTMGKVLLIISDVLL